MTKQNQAKITRRNLMIAVGLSTGATTGVAAGGSTMVEPASAQLGGDVAITVNDGRALDYPSGDKTKIKPTQLSIDGGSEIILTQLSAQQDEPAMLEVHARIKDSGTWSEWGVIGEAGFIIESSTERINMSSLSNRDLFVHKDIKKTKFEVENDSLKDATDRFINKKLEMRVVVETLSGAVIISKDDVEGVVFDISYGYQHGIGKNMGRNFGRVAPEYKSGTRWDKVPQVPDDEPPVWFQAAAELVDKIESVDESGNQESVTLPSSESYTLKIDGSDSKVIIPSKDVEMEIETMHDINKNINDVYDGDTIAFKIDDDNNIKRS